RNCSASWYRVQLPIRPNGVTGFIRARTVEVARVRTRILVDVSARRLTLFRRGKPVLRTTVAVGSRATPTPTGRYYVNQRLIPAALAATFAALAGRPRPAAPDPQEAVTDGCGRNNTRQLLKEIPTWVYVGDHAAPSTGPPPPPQRLEGVISSRYYPDLAVHP